MISDSTLKQNSLQISGSSKISHALCDRLLKPPLKWAGGKRWLVPNLRSIWDQQRQSRYVEPFCGGLAAPLALQPAQALLNDVNPHLVNFYRQVQEGLAVRVEMRNDAKLFYTHRARFNHLVHQGDWQSQEAAELFYYLNRTCFNGLCRFNRRGEFNVPFGRYQTINYLSDFRAYREVFSQWEFTNCDLESLPAEAGDFIYADPPYDVEFTSYSAGGFTWEDQIRTAEWLAKHPGPVVLSNQATPRIVALYSELGFELRFLSAPRRISCNGNRQAASEVLAIKF